MDTGSGAGAELDYLIGTCRDEMNLFDAFPGDAALTGFRHRQQTLFDAAGVDESKVKAAYQLARPGLDDEPVDLAIMGDMWFRVPSIRIAEDHAAQDDGRTFMYLFEWESQILGAAHAMDLLVFGNGMPMPGLAGLSDYEAVAKRMRKSWVSFAQTGDPSTPDFRWQQYDSNHRWTTAINDELLLLEDPYKHQRRALGELLTMSWQKRDV